MQFGSVEGRPDGAHGSQVSGSSVLPSPHRTGAALEEEGSGGGEERPAEEGAAEDDAGAEEEAGADEDAGADEEGAADEDVGAALLEGGKENP